MVVAGVFDRSFLSWRLSRAFVATNFFCTAYSLLTAVFVKKLIGKGWLHPVDQVCAYCKKQNYIHLN
jgi:hypothetical protein